MAELGLLCLQGRAWPRLGDAKDGCRRAPHWGGAPLQSLSRGPARRGPRTALSTPRSLLVVELWVRRVGQGADLPAASRGSLPAEKRSWRSRALSRELRPLRSAWSWPREKGLQASLQPGPASQHLRARTRPTRAGSSALLGPGPPWRDVNPHLGIWGAGRHEQGQARPASSRRVSAGLATHWPSEGPPRPALCAPPCRQRPVSLRLTALASDPWGRSSQRPLCPRRQLCPLEPEGAALRPPMHLLTTWTVDWGHGKTWGG